MEKIEWSVVANNEWATLAMLEDDEKASIQWDGVPEAFDDTVHLHVWSNAGDYRQVHLPMSNRRVPVASYGVVESDGHVSIEAAAVPLDEKREKYYAIHPVLRCGATGGMALRPSLDSS